jgi:hypothetical protein
MLHQNTKDYSLLLLPHLEPWLNVHFSAPIQDRLGPEELELGHFLDPRKSLFLTYFDVRWGSRGLDGELGTVDSISMNTFPSLAQVDITRSPREQWWLFLWCPSDMDDEDLEWTLVNYDKQRMYVHPNASEALSWEGKDVYDMSTWARLTFMGEIWE